jgi:hypothetical protein
MSPEKVYYSTEAIKMTSGTVENAVWEGDVEIGN